jgi:hypothetical protein
MSVPEIIDDYESDDEPLRKLEECDYCPFTEMLRGPYAKAGILRADIPEQHPHRSTIEDVCGRGVDKPCAMKYAIMRTPISDYMLAQMESQITFRMDLGKSRNEKIDANTAGVEWAKKRDSLVGADGNFGSSYAKRWEEIWELSLCTNGKHSLTEIGMYRFGLVLFGCSPGNNNSYESE